MKARLKLKQYGNEKTAPKSWREQMQVEFGKDPTGKVVPIYFWPPGVILDGPVVVDMCIRGQCSPADDECAAAVGMTPDQIEAQQVEYAMNCLGINSESDRELYRAGVIKGYDKDLKPIPGPNWEAYQAAKAETEDEDI